MKTLDKVFSLASKVLITAFIIYIMYLLGVHKIIIGQTMFYKDYYEKHK